MVARTLLLAALVLITAPVYGVFAQQAIPVPNGTSAQPLTTVGDTPDYRPVLHRRDDRYRLNSGDTLGLNFPYTPEFNQTITIHPDGFITLRAVGDLRVLGQTLPELVQSLETVYGKLLRDPVVTVELKDFEKPYFIVGGEVGHPGKFDLRSDTTVFGALAIAGGVKESAKHSQVLLFRPYSDGMAEVHVINVKKMVQGKSLAEDVHLRPGDILFVPQNVISKIKPFLPVPGIGLYPVL